MINTCVTLDCPFIWYCKEYNFTVDRGDHCDHQDQILRQAKRLEKQRKMQRKLQKEANNATPKI